MTEKMLTILLALFMLLPVLTDCGSGGTGFRSTTSGQSPTGSGGSTGKKIIGMVVKNTSTEYVQVFMVGAQETCDKYGIKLKIADGKADSLKIMDVIGTFITQGIDSSALAGMEDLVMLIPGIKKPNKGGIPVFAADTCPEGGHVGMFTTNDIMDSSRKAAAQVVQGIKGANDGEVPKGATTEITGSLVDMCTAECHEGFSSVVEQYPRLTVVQDKGHWNNDDSHSHTSDLLTRYGDDVLGIYVHTPDIMGSDVVATVETVGLDPVNYFIPGVYIGVGGMHLLNEGKLYTVVEQPALDITTMTVGCMNRMFNGGEIPKMGDTIMKEGALWPPVKATNNEFVGSGTTMILQSPLVPQEYQPSDERLYKSRIG